MSSFATLPTGRRMALVLALVVLCLHLPAHLGFDDGLRGKEALPQDGPAIVDNARLGGADDFGDLAGVLKRAVVEPAAAWDAGSKARPGTRRAPPRRGAVGRSRWRPVTGVLFGLERSVFGRELAPQGIALVSLALHVLVVLLTASLAGRVGASPRAGFVAALLVAASPAALGPVDWPAQQGIVLGAALGLGGVNLVVGGRRTLLGATLLGLAVLSHELAFGLALAVPVLQAAATNGSRARSWRWAAIPAAAAAVVVIVVLWPGAGAPAGPVAAPSLPDRFVRAFVGGAVGIVNAIGAFLLPVRTRFVGAPWTPGLVEGLVCVAVLGVACVLVRRHRALPSVSVAGAALVALTPLFAVGLRGGAPFVDGYLYCALPLLGIAVGMALVSTVSASGRRRAAAIAAGALLLGASVAGTITRSHAFRTRQGVVRLARAEVGADAVTLTWELAHRLKTLPDDRTAVVQALRDVVPLVRDVLRVATPDGGPPAGGLERDAVAASTVAETLTAYAVFVARAGLASEDPLHAEAEAAGSGATRVAPGHAVAWSTLAGVRARLGDLRDAFRAARRADELRPDDPGATATLAEIALRLGEPAYAVEQMDDLAAVLSARAERLQPEYELLLARALIDDGATREITPNRDLRDQFVSQYRFERALSLLTKLAENPQLDRQLRAAAGRLLHRGYLLYGDFLASRDATYLALRSYGKAKAIEEQMRRRGPATEHLEWLEARLERELAEAIAELTLASQGTGNIADSKLRIAIILCRRGGFDDADAIFLEIEQAQGGMNPALRFQRALHRYAWSPLHADLERAVTEFNQVLADDPKLVRARHELGRALEGLGLFQKALNAYHKAARQGVLYEWGLEASEDAERLSALVTSLVDLSREQGSGADGR